MVFWLIVITCPLLGVLWWALTDRRLRKAGVRARWRVALGVFSALMAGGFIWLFFSRLMDWPRLPLVFLAAVYLWHLVVLPITVVFVLASAIARSGVTLGRRLARKPAEWVGPVDIQVGLTRRQVLAGVAAAVPPVVLAGATTRGLMGMQGFRINNMTVRVPGLPTALQGMTIAHVSDTHVGRFTGPEKLEAVVKAVNALESDLVLMTGDLIDFDLDDLPRSLELVKQFQSKYGLFMCEGNHDLIEDRRGFEQGVLSSGVKLLLNRERSVRVRGQEVQLLGLKWGVPGQRRDAQIASHMDELRPQIRSDAFPILLAHHPHAFDDAIAADIPLTLAGHTHGGQLMLSEKIGPGAWMYKYWSGLYQKGSSSLVVSNGVGNWFPLRINAPAEIVHIRLEKAAT